MPTSWAFWAEATAFHIIIVYNIVVVQAIYHDIFCFNGCYRHWPIIKDFRQK